MELEDFELSNLSQGGMCVEGMGGLQEGEIEHFLLDLTEPYPSIVLVRVEVRWAQPTPSGNHVMGVRFLESSNAWLGTSDSDQNGR